MLRSRYIALLAYDGLDKQTIWLNANPNLLMLNH